MLPLVQIRKMGIREIDTVASLINKYFPSSNSSNLAITSKLASSSHFFVAKLNKIVVGFLEIKLMDRSALVVGIATESDYSNKGIGTALIEHAIDFAKRKGKNKISLVVKATNVKAINLYRRYGFIVKRAKRGIQEDVFLMSKEIEN